MGQDEKPKVVAKKLSPFPFEATLDHAGVKKPMEVLFLNQTGLLGRADKVFVHVGEHLQISFELPVLKHVIFTPVRVLKTYDKAGDGKAQKVERLIELHFEKLSDEQKAHLFAFLAAIGQSK